MNWKLEIAHLRDQAAPVLTNERARTGMAAREVARVLSGVTSVIARSTSVEEMQAACAALALDDRAWKSHLAVLPRDSETGKIDRSVEMIAVVCRGVLGASSIEAVRAAVSFWAAENDAAVWQQIAA